MTEQHTPRPGRFIDRVTTAGHRLTLVGANGEDVVLSEHHPAFAGVGDSLEVIVRTVLDAVPDPDALHTVTGTEHAVRETVAALLAGARP